MLEIPAEAIAERARAEERARIVADLKRAADGRREYASDLEPSHWGKKDLLAEADTLDTAAKISDGDPLTMCGLIPSWRWTDQEAAAATAPKADESEPATSPQAAPESTETDATGVPRVCGWSDDGTSLETPTAPQGVYEELAELRKRVADYENAIGWNVSCFRCANQLDRTYAADMRAEQAEAAVARARELHQRDDSNPRGPWCGTCLTVWPCATIRALDVPADGEQTGDAQAASYAEVAADQEARMKAARDAEWLTDLGETGGGNG